MRLSGPDSIPIAQNIFKGGNGRVLHELPSHRISYGHIVSGEKVIDEVLITVMRAPRTYTKEDIVEINCHGGIVPLKRVLELTLSGGARLAEPGEFTKRAFLNGRIDLSQAEAVLDIINSRTEKSCNAALSQLGGILRGKVEDMCRKINDMLVNVEAAIDFSTEGILPPSNNELCSGILSLTEEIEKLLSTANAGTVLREGLKVSIVGRPNVGKSSLFNAIVGNERVIVTPVPGTTRDVVEEMVTMEGIPVIIADTAGIVRNSTDVIEKEGVIRSLRSFNESDLSIIVIDGSEPLTEKDICVLEDFREKKSITVINKCDLPVNVRCSQVEAITGKNGVLMVSAVRNAGIDSLRKAIAHTVWSGELEADEQIIVTRVRHAGALSKALNALKCALACLKESMSEEILAFELRQSLDSLGEIVGKGTNEDILNGIFSEFCIGK